MVAEHLIDIGTGRVRYLEAGAGWPLVLLHAFPLSADMWRPQLEAPPRGWRLLAPDLRGFGPDAAGAAASLDDMAEDLRAWLDALRLERAIVGGLSMGGYVTFALYRLAPERFSGMVLANTRATADTDEARAGRDRMIAVVREQGVPAVAEAMLPRLLGTTAVRERPELPEAVRRLIEGNRAPGIAGALEAMKARPDSTPLLDRVSVPVLVVAGAEDALVSREESEDIARHLQRCQFVVIPRAGHLSSFENPDDFAEVLGTFLHANL